MHPDKNSDWVARVSHVRLAGVREHKERLDKLSHSDAEHAEAKLQMFLEELNVITKGRIKIYAKEAVAQENGKVLGQHRIVRYEDLDED